MITDNTLDTFWVSVISVLMFGAAPIAGGLIVFALMLYGVLSFLFAFSDALEASKE